MVLYYICVYICKAVMPYIINTINGRVVQPVYIANIIA